MNATRGNLLDDVLGKTQQLLVPIYQRHYSWETEQCRELWNDILDVGGHDNTKHHFLGSVVFQENPVPSPIPKLIIIDGQQRIATVILLLEAFARQLEPQNSVVSPEKIRNIYLRNQYETYKHKHRMVLSEADAGSLKAVVDGNDLRLSLHIDENFSWFCSKINQLSEDEHETLWKGLRKLSIVEIKLDNSDNPQRMFETMNSTGLDLREYDKIRNYILMGLNSDRQNFLYKEYWRAIERTFEQKDYEKYFDDFVQHYLVMRLEKLQRAAKYVYKTFKKLPSCNYEEKENLLADMHKYAVYFSRIVLHTEQDQDLARTFCDIQTLKVDVSYPFLMCLYGDYTDKHLPKNEFIEIIRLVESYVFRRSVCGLRSSDTKSSILDMLKNYKNGGLQRMKDGLHNLGANKLFPPDHMFMDSFPFYQKNLSYWPARLENHFRKKPLPDDYTIEHIMPQQLSAEWIDTLGKGRVETHEKYLNVPGNITLTRHNSGLSNLTYSKKYHTPKAGYKHDKLKLNESLNDGVWNEATIEARSKELANLAVACWPYPRLQTSYSYLGERV